MVPSSSPVILDGGLSTALEQRGADLTGSLWTARLLLDEPELVAEAHRDFYRAGAQVATAATYQATVDGFTAAGLDRDEAAALLTRAVRIAVEVRDEERDVVGDDGGELLVAASVGPYGASRADGSEYRGRYGLTAAQLRDFHGPRLELLAAAGADLLAVETVPDADEAVVLTELLGQLGLPAWFSYSVRGDATNAGQPLADAYAVLADCAPLVAVGVNCSDQADVLGAVEAAVAVTGRPAVAYPNRGGTWDAVSKTWSTGVPLDLDLVDAWVAAGASYVGGCCGLGPADIGALAAHLGDRRVSPPAGG